MGAAGLVLSSLRKPRWLGVGLMTLASASLLVSVPAYAMSEASVQGFAAAMKNAANSQNIGKVAELISDEAIISLSRGNKSTSLDKNGYLQLLQKGWAKAKNYRYDIQVSNAVITGDQARVQITTTETWTENGRPVRITTSSRATLSEMSGSAVILRSVTQVSVN
ncbi:hypothetical protein B0181_05350 [Moraxella caviae]|uniref:DUF4440 domain-containing protein n=1 Tax=Moraxella caviae TaxID=34060 RepID=A0A1T0A312_9GAMM|nr:hypothetical protein B0181_05350 [Moraxella caviae]